MNQSQFEKNYLLLNDDETSTSRVAKRGCFASFVASTANDPKDCAPTGKKETKKQTDKVKEVSPLKNCTVKGREKGLGKKRKNSTPGKKQAICKGELRLACNPLKMQTPRLEMGP